MGLNEAKKSLENLSKKYEQSFIDYAENGFINSLAFCLKNIAPETAGKILDSYPTEIQNKIRNTQIEISAFARREIAYVLSQEDLICEDDYLELQNSLSDITEEDYSELRNMDIVSNNAWLKNRLHTFAPIIIHVDSINSYNLMALQKSLIIKDYLCLKTFANERIFNKFWDLLSKNNKKDFSEEMKYMKTPTLEDYNETLEKIEGFFSYKDQDFKDDDEFILRF